MGSRYCFVCSGHYISPKMFIEFTGVEKGEERPEKRQLVKFCFVVMAAFFSAAAVYLGFGMVGFARFGHKVNGNVLKSYGTDYDPQGIPHWVVDVAWVMVILNCVITWVFVYNIMWDAWKVLLHAFIGLCKRQYPSPYPEWFKLINYLIDNSLSTKMHKYYIWNIS